MHPASGFGHLDSLVDDIKKKESDRVKLESQVRQLRLRAESEAADGSQLKAELEASQAERLSLQKRIGLLSRKNEDLARENAKLVEEKCDFQRSMANNEAKLKQNEEELRRAQKAFVEDLETANQAYSRNRAIVNTLLGRKGAGCVEVPSSDELDGLKAAAAKTQGAILRAAELEAQLRGLEAESLALKSEATEGARIQESLRKEVASLKTKSANNNNKIGQGKRYSGGGDAAARENHQQQQRQQQQQQQQQQRVSQLEQEIGNLEDTCSRQADYINQLEDYANGIEAQLQAMQQQGGGDGGGGSGDMVNDAGISTADMGDDAQDPSKIGHHGDCSAMQQSA